MLSQKQIDEYHEVGAIVVPDVLGAEELARLRAVTDEFVENSRGLTAHDDVYDLEDSHSPAQPRVRRIKTPHLQHAEYARLVRNKKIVEVLTDLWGPNVRFDTGKLNLKSANFGAPVEWHQDWAFYPHTNDDLAAVGVMMDDMALENGPLLILPGSHKGKVYDHHANGRFCGAMDPEGCGCDFSKALPLTGRAGSISVHHVRAIHGSAANLSERDRRLLLYQYRAADAWPLIQKPSSIEAFDELMVAGTSTLEPRLTAVPVRLPLPPTEREGSIYESQKRPCAPLLRYGSGAGRFVNSCRLRPAAHNCQQARRRRARKHHMLTGTALRAVIAGFASLFLFATQTAFAQTRIEFASWQLAEKGRAEKFNALLDKFAKDHPKVAIEKVVIPYPVFEQTIFTQAGQGGGPDVFFVADEALPKAIKAGFAEPLGDLLNLSSLNLTPLNQVAVSDGKQYGLAWEAITYNLIYNKELLASVGANVPTSYDEFLDASKRLKAKGVFAFAFRSAPAEAAGMWYDVSDWVYGLGGRWAKAGKPQFDSESVVKAIERLSDIYKAGYVPKGADAATYRRMFWEGKIGMMIDNLSVPTIVVSANPAMLNKIGIAPVPFESHEHTAITTFIVINSHSTHKREAAELVSYLYSKEGQLAVSDMLGGGSVVGTNISPSQDALASMPAWVAEAKKAEAAQAVVSPVPEGLAVKATELKTVLSDAVEQVLFGGVSPAPAMREAQKRAVDIAAR